jgi:hypothetical protein
MAHRHTQNEEDFDNYDPTPYEVTSCFLCFLELFCRRNLVWLRFDVRCIFLMLLYLSVCLSVSALVGFSWEF